MPGSLLRAASNQRVRVSGRCDGLPQACAGASRSSGQVVTGSSRSKAWISKGRRCGWCLRHSSSSQRAARGCWCSRHRRVQHWRASSSWPQSLLWQASIYSRSRSSGAWRCCSATIAQKVLLAMPAWLNCTSKRWIKASSAGKAMQVCVVAKRLYSNSGRLWNRYSRLRVNHKVSICAAGDQSFISAVSNGSGSAVRSRKASTCSGCSSLSSWLAQPRRAASICTQLWDNGLVCIRL
ncbi:hypothetical protein D3C76_791570 [compost metagenome]